MLLVSLSIIIGLILLVWSADRFILGAMGLARHLEVSPLIIGIIVVGFGTSAPELFISAIAALRDTTGFAVGNALGSNITNIALILGITACLTPLVVKESVFRREFPILLSATAITWIFIQDQLLTWLEGCTLIVLMILVLYLMARSSQDHKPTLDTESELGSQPNDHTQTLTYSIFWLVLGLIILLVSSDILVTASVELARMVGIPDVVIGLTIIAIGTSLPELAASVTGALKHHTDLAIGNIIGSNIFNILGVMSIPALITHYPIPRDAVYKDFIVMAALVILLMILAFITRQRGGLSKLSGIILIGCFIAYQVSLYLRTTMSL